jgi:tetratricopeptide (TPR) repeat protein
MNEQSYPSLRALILAALLGLTAARAVAADAASLAALRDEVELAYRAGDAERIETARQHLLLAAQAGSADRAEYFAAHARFRQALLAAGNGRVARARLDDCIAELQAYTEGAPGDAEARALLGSCYGVSTRYHRLGMASRGLAARRHLAAAVALAPANPWVVLQAGLADHATPRVFGGDRTAAIAKLERATALFATAAAAGSSTATWGAAEAWEQLALMYRAAGRAPEAERALERARSLQPDAGAARLATL